MLKECTAEIWIRFEISAIPDVDKRRHSLFGFHVETSKLISFIHFSDKLLVKADHDGQTEGDPGRVQLKVGPGNGP